MPRSYRHYADGEYLYFVTSTIIEWTPLFLSHRHFDILLDGLIHCRRHKGLRVHAYVLMPNHFHAIVSSEPTDALPGIMRDLKRHTSTRLQECLREDRAEFLLRLLRMASAPSRLHIWRDGYHPEAIFTQKFFRQKLDYLHDNPVRKGYVRAPQDWLYSSAWDYIEGSVGMMEIDRLEVT